MAPLKLKLKIGGTGGSSNNSGETASKSSKAPTKLPKIKLNVPKPPKVTNPNKIQKLKISLGPKKTHQLDAIGIEGVTSQVKRVPKVRIKPTRVPGEGYDSETPDMEDDPLIENGIIIRFLNDINLDHVHNAVGANDFSGINVKWLTKEKALVNVKGSIYSARLVDLPTISEVFKTIDKKNIFKILDLCQMLLVIKPVTPNDLNLETDFEVPSKSHYKHPLYNISPGHEIKETRPVLRDGLTQPFEDVYRRFRPRKINHRVMNDIEAKVDELIRLDNEAEESHFEILDGNRAQMIGSAKFSPSPPPVAQFSTVNSYQTELISEDLMGMEDEEENIDLEEELAKALDTNVGVMDGDFDDENMVIEGAISGAEDEEDEEEDNDDENDEDDDDDDEEDDEDDEDEDEEHKAGTQHAKMLQEEIGDLERAVESNRKALANATHRMMKMKFQSNYNTLKASLDSKKRELAKILEEEEEEDDEDEDEEGGVGASENQNGTQNANENDNSENDHNNDDDNDDDSDNNADNADDLDDLF